jgi:hypothetical protein
VDTGIRTSKLPRRLYIENINSSAWIQKTLIKHMVDLTYQINAGDCWIK